MCQWHDNPVIIPSALGSCLGQQTVHRSVYLMRAPGGLLLWEEGVLNGRGRWAGAMVALCPYIKKITTYIGDRLETYVHCFS